MGKVVVDVKDFSFKYRQTKHKALKNVSFQVEEGSFFCIIGANGSGKSTLCNALVGLIPHYFVGKMSGSVTIDGDQGSGNRIGQGAGQPGQDHTPDLLEETSLNHVTGYQTTEDTY